MRREGNGKGEKGRRSKTLIRTIFSFFFLLLPFSLFAQNALILIQHDQSGPNLQSADYIHGQWILWPPDQLGWSNRILSLASGLDLQAEPSDASFRFGTLPSAPGVKGWIPQNGASLERRGFFDARAVFLGTLGTTVVEKAKRGVSRSVFLLALSGNDKVVPTRPFETSFPPDGLVVHEAANWDDAIAVQKRVSGRTLIVEYPPVDKLLWSRFWLYGKWPAGTPTERDLGIPGLVRARKALAMLLDPATAEWRPSDAGRWGGANRWFEHGWDSSWGVLLAWFCGAAIVLVWALAQVMNEDRGPFVSELLVLLALSPASIVLAGSGARLGGLDAWPIVLVLSILGLYGLSLLAGLLARRFEPEAHPLWIPCLIGFAVMSLCDPLWSDFSGRFGVLDLDVPGDALGAFLAYLTGVASFARGRWFGRVVAAAVLAWGASSRPWWVDGHPALLTLPACALAASEGLLRPTLLAVLAFLPTQIVKIWNDGAVWNPGGLLAAAGEARAIDFWYAAPLILSPAWIGTFVFLAIGLLVGNRFLAYRLRKLLRLDPRLRSMPWMAGATLALGCLEPLALPATPVLAFGAMIGLAYDGLRANA